MANAMISGKLASIDVGGSELVGVMNYSHSGGTRTVIEGPPYMDAAYLERLPGHLIGGDIEVSGVIADIDNAVWLALIAAFHAATTYAYDGIKFFINATDYITPDNALVPAPYVWLTKCPDAVVIDAADVAKVSMTFGVSGQMELVQPA